MPVGPGAVKALKLALTRGKQVHQLLGNLGRRDTEESLPLDAALQRWETLKQTQREPSPDAPDVLTEWGQSLALQGIPETALRQPQLAAPVRHLGPQPPVPQPIPGLDALPGGLEIPVQPAMVPDPTALPGVLDQLEALKSRIPDPVQLQQTLEDLVTVPGTTPFPVPGIDPPRVANTNLSEIESLLATIRGITSPTSVTELGQSSTRDLSSEAYRTGRKAESLDEWLLQQQARESGSGLKRQVSELQVGTTHPKSNLAEGHESKMSRKAAGQLADAQYESGGSFGPDGILTEEAARERLIDAIRRGTQPGLLLPRSQFEAMVEGGEHGQPRYLTLTDDMTEAGNDQPLRARVVGTRAFQRVQWNVVRPDGRILGTFPTEDAAKTAAARTPGLEVKKAIDLQGHYSKEQTDALWKNKQAQGYRPTKPDGRSDDYIPPPESRPDHPEAGYTPELERTWKQVGLMTQLPPRLVRDAWRASGDEELMVVLLKAEGVPERAASDAAALAARAQLEADVKLTRGFGTADPDAVRAARARLGKAQPNNLRRLLADPLDRVDYPEPGPATAHVPSKAEQDFRAGTHQPRFHETKRLAGPGSHLEAVPNSALPGVIAGNPDPRVQKMVTLPDGTQRPILHTQSVSPHERTDTVESPVKRTAGREVGTYPRREDQDVKIIPNTRVQKIVVKGDDDDVLSTVSETGKRMPLEHQGRQTLERELYPLDTETLVRNGFTMLPKHQQLPTGKDGVFIVAIHRDGKRVMVTPETVGPITETTLDQLPKAVIPDFLKGEPPVPPMADTREVARKGVTVSERHTNARIRKGGFKIISGGRDGGIQEAAVHAARAAGVPVEGRALSRAKEGPQSDAQRLGLSPLDVSKHPELRNAGSKGIYQLRSMQNMEIADSAIILTRWTKGGSPSHRVGSSMGPTGRQDERFGAASQEAWDYAKRNGLPVHVIDITQKTPKQVEDEIVTFVLENNLYAPNIEGNRLAHLADETELKDRKLRGKTALDRRDAYQDALRRAFVRIKAATPDAPAPKIPEKSTPELSPYPLTDAAKAREIPLETRKILGSELGDHEARLGQQRLEALQQQPAGKASGPLVDRPAPEVPSLGASLGLSKQRQALLKELQTRQQAGQDVAPIQKALVEIEAQLAQVPNPLIAGTRAMDQARRPASEVKDPSADAVALLKKRHELQRQVAESVGKEDNALLRAKLHAIESELQKHAETGVLAHLLQNPQLMKAQLELPERPPKPGPTVPRTTAEAIREIGQPTRERARVVPQGDSSVTVKGDVQPGAADVLPKVDVPEGVKPAAVRQPPPVTKPQAPEGVPAVAQIYERAADVFERMGPEEFAKRGWPERLRMALKRALEGETPQVFPEAAAGKAMTPEQVAASGSQRQMWAPSAQSASAPKSAKAQEAAALKEAQQEQARETRKAQFVEGLLAWKDPVTRKLLNDPSSILGLMAAVGGVTAAELLGPDQAEVEAALAAMPKDGSEIQAGGLSPAAVEAIGRAIRRGIDLIAGWLPSGTKTIEPRKSTGIEPGHPGYMQQEQRRNAPIVETREPILRKLQRTVQDKTVPVWEANEAKFQAGQAAPGTERVKDGLDTRLGGGNGFTLRTIAEGRPLFDRISELNLGPALTRYLDARTTERAWDTTLEKARAQGQQLARLQLQSRGAEAARLGENLRTISKNLEASTVAPQNLTKADADAELKALKASMPEEHWKALEDVHAFMDKENRLRIGRAKSTVLTARQAEVLEKRTSLYAPIIYDAERASAVYDPMNDVFLQGRKSRYEEARITKAKGGSLSLSEELLLKREMLGKGVTDQVARNPLEAWAEHIQEVDREIARNEAAKLVVTQGGDWKLAQELGIRMAKPNEPVPAGMATLSYLEKGKPQKAFVPAEWVDAIEFVDPLDVTMGSKLLKKTRSLMQSMTTSSNLGFLLKNLPRDVQDSLMLTPGIESGDVEKFMQLWARNYVELARHDGHASKDRTGVTAMRKRFYESGASMSSLMHNIAPEEFLQINPKRKGTGLIQWSQKTLNATEQATKEAVFELLIGKGVDERRAASLTREFGGSPDFAKRGALTSEAANYLMFLNPQIQGSVRTIKALRNNPARAARQLASLTAVLSGLHAWNYSFKDDDGNPMIHDMSEFDRANNMIVLLPWKETSKNGAVKQAAVRIPMGHAAKVLMNPIQTAIRLTWGDIKDPSASVAEGVAEGVGNFLPGNLKLGGSVKETVGSVVSGLNPLLKVPVEQLADHNTFTGSPIVGRRLSKNSTTFQSGPHTSPIAKGVATGLSKVIGDKTWLTSPARLEAGFKGFVPGVGEMALGAADWGVRQLSGDTGTVGGTTSETLGKKPFGPIARAFIGSPVSQVREDLAEPFYAALEDASAKVADVNTLLRDGRTEDAKALRQEPLVQWAQRHHAQLTAWSRQIGELAKAKRKLETADGARAEAQLRELHQRELAVLRKAKAVIDKRPD